MKTLSQHLDDYLKLRRQLGYKMQVGGVFCFAILCALPNKKAQEFIRTKLALRWAAQPNMKPAQSGSRLGVVRRFAEHVSAYDARTEVPPQKLLPYQFRRRDPYHYTEEHVFNWSAPLRQINPASQIQRPDVWHRAWDCWR